jgi:hypothetical protein
LYAPVDLDVVWFFFCFFHRVLCLSGSAVALCAPLFGAAVLATRQIGGADH